MNKYQPVIGLEVHIELGTVSKMFCSCSADYFGAKPNTHTCPVCLGLPGAMPKANVQAIVYAQMLGLALNCQAQLSSKFDRKNYFYPDLPKGFQISQYDQPFAQIGFIEVETALGSKKVRITRAHLEEDTGKLTHALINGKNVSLIDFNRSGLPLVEVVSEPDMRSSEEAKAYAQKLQQIARYLNISDCDMEKGSMRIEPNVSLRKKGQKSLPEYKVELKNINSFKFAQKAIEYEIARQTEILEKDEIPALETRGWNEAKNQTVSQRSKELAHDYRYFPEPDLPPYTFPKKDLETIKKNLPELPDGKIVRFQKQYQLSLYDSTLLSQDLSLANFFEETVKVYKNGEPKRIANWIIGELLRRLNETQKPLKDVNILPASVVQLLIKVDSGEISTASAKKVFEKMFTSGQTAEHLIIGMNLQGLSDDKLAEVVEQVIRTNEKAAKDFLEGKDQALGFLIGQVQRQTQGRGDPKVIIALIRSKIKAQK